MSFFAYFQAAGWYQAVTEVEYFEFGPYGVPALVAVSRELGHTDCYGIVGRNLEPPLLSVISFTFALCLFLPTTGGWGYSNFFVRRETKAPFSCKFSPVSPTICPLTAHPTPRLFLRVFHLDPRG